MKKIMVIIPAAVLTIGAATMGVLANKASAEKPGISVDYASAFSRNNAQSAEKSSAVTVTSRANSSGNFVDDNNDGIYDNYADGSCPQNGTGNGYGCGNGNFVDNDNDGICDNYANGTCPQNGTGNGYGCGNGNFVDNDNDGICDNYANGPRPQNGAGNGNRRGNGSFVDNDNDGICDNYANGTRPQNGTGNGYGCGNGCRGKGCGRKGA